MNGLIKDYSTLKQVVVDGQPCAAITEFDAATLTITVEFRQWNPNTREEVDPLVVRVNRDQVVSLRQRINTQSTSLEDFITDAQSFAAAQAGGGG